MAQKKVRLPSRISMLETPAGRRSGLTLATQLAGARVALSANVERNAVAGVVEDEREGLVKALAGIISPDVLAELNDFVRGVKSHYIHLRDEPVVDGAVAVVVDAVACFVATRPRVGARVTGAGGAIVFGIRCRSMILGRLEPTEIAAST